MSAFGFVEFVREVMHKDGQDVVFEVWEGCLIRGTELVVCRNCGLVSFDGSHLDLHSIC